MADIGYGIGLIALILLRASHIASQTESADA
jgi:hypothetical protein